MILTRRILGPCMVTPENDGRPILENVCIRNGRAYGSNGFMAVSIPLDDAPEGEHLVPAAALKAVANAMRKPGPFLTTDAMMGIPVEAQSRQQGYYETGVTTDGRLHTRVNAVESTLDRHTSDKPYPNVEGLKPTTPPALTITFTTSLLRQLLAALETAGADMQVTMDLYDKHSVVLLHGEDSDGGIVEGLIMPARKAGRDGHVIFEGEGVDAS